MKELFLIDFFLILQSPRVAKKKIRLRAASETDNTRRRPTIEA